MNASSSFLRLFILVLCSWAALTSPVRAGEIALAELVVLDFTTPPAFSFLSWENKPQIDHGALRLQVPDGRGGCGYVIQRGLTACADRTPVLTVTVGQGNRSKSLRLAEEATQKKKAAEAMAQRTRELLAGAPHPADGPDVRHVAPVAADILALSIQEKEFIPVAQIPYVAQDADIVKRVGKQEDRVLVLEDGKVQESLLEVVVQRKEGNQEVTLGRLAVNAQRIKPEDKIAGQDLTTETIAEPAAYRIVGVNDPGWKEPLAPSQVWWKRKPNAFQSTAFEVQIFLKLPKPLREGNRYRVEFPGINVRQASLEYLHEPSEDAQRGGARLRHWIASGRPVQARLPVHVARYGRRLPLWRSPSLLLARRCDGPGSIRRHDAGAKERGRPGGFQGGPELQQDRRAGNGLQRLPDAGPLPGLCRRHRLLVPVRHRGGRVDTGLPGFDAGPVASPQRDRVGASLHRLPAAAEHAPGRWRQDLRVGG